MKDTHISLDKLKLQCREAALGHIRWDSLMSDISQWLGAERAMMLSSKENQPYTVTCSHNFDVAIVNKYNTEHNLDDPRMPFSKLTKPGQTKTGQQYLPNHKIEHSDYFHLVSRKNNIKDSIHSVLLDSPHTGRQALSFHRGFRKDFFTRVHLDKMQVLLPYLINAYQYSTSVAAQFSPDHSNSSSMLIDNKMKTTVLNGIIQEVLLGCSDISWNGAHLRPKNSALKSFLLLAIEKAQQGQTVQCRLKLHSSLLSGKATHIKMTISP